MPDAKGDENHKDRLKHAPDNSRIALLLVDVINDLNFPGGEKHDLNIIVPSDCIASEDLEQTQLVLALMHRVLKDDITPLDSGDPLIA